MEETFKIICKVHSKLPNGGILVFLTGKKEINEMCEKLRTEFFNNKIVTEDEHKIKEAVDNNAQILMTNDEFELENSVDNEKDIKEVNSDDDNDQHQETKKKYSEAIILPLYSSLPQVEQNRVFHKDLENKRLIVISTNVAETSLTIPNIKYIVDSGKEKKRVNLLIK